MSTQERVLRAMYSRVCIKNVQLCEAAAQSAGLWGEDAEGLGTGRAVIFPGSAFFTL